MSKPKKIEILISENGDQMQVIAHNFQGQGCQAVADAFRFGNVVECAPTAEFYETSDQNNSQTQGQ